MRFRDRFQQFMQQNMQGRYGYDGFSRFLLWVGLIFLIISMFLVRFPLAGRICNVLALLVFVYMWYRTFSRDRQKRIAENYKYYEFVNKVKDIFKFRKGGSGFSYTKTPVKPVRDPNYKYFKCPKCKKTVKVPKYHGKIEITCRNCNEKFIRFTGKRK